MAVTNKGRFHVRIFYKIIIKIKQFAINNVAAVG